MPLFRQCSLTEYQEPGLEVQEKLEKRREKKKKKRKAGERRKKGREERKRKGMQCSEVGTTPYLSERYGGALGGCVTC